MQQWIDGNMLIELINESYKDLEEGTAKILRKLYVFLDTFDAKAQDFICQDKDNEHLTKLLERQLVMFNAKSECYSLHPLIQKFFSCNFKRSLLKITGKKIHSCAGWCDSSS